MKTTSTDCETLYKSTLEKLSGISETFCLAKWLNVSLHLHLGTGRSCHHPPLKKIPSENLEKSPHKLHNTESKLKERADLLNGIRNSACDYCWRMEKGKESGTFSDRVVKSSNDWAMRQFDAVRESHLGENITPSYLEISFSDKCQLQCLYCNPFFSSRWAADVLKNGDFNGRPLVEKYLHTEKFNSEENIYLKAFWNWWPQLKDSLDTLRITGGEPLLSKDFWKIRDLSYEGELKGINVIINSNLSLPASIVDDLSNWIFEALEKKLVKSIMVVTSMEAIGKQAEFIRYGINFKLWSENIKKVAQSHPALKMSVTSTLQILSYSSFFDFIDYFLHFREENKMPEFFFDPSYLVEPSFMSMLKAPPQIKQNFVNRINETVTRLNGRLLPYEKIRMRSLISAIQQDSEIEVDYLYVRFYQYFEHFRQRSGLDLESIFPELSTFWKRCKALNGNVNSFQL